MTVTLSPVCKSNIFSIVDDAKAPPLMFKNEHLLPDYFIYVGFLRSHQSVNVCSKAFTVVKEVMSPFKGHPNNISLEKRIFKRHLNSKRQVRYMYSLDFYNVFCSYLPRGTMLHFDRLSIALDINTQAGFSISAL